MSLGNPSLIWHFLESNRGPQFSGMTLERLRYPALPTVLQGVVKTSEGGYQEICGGL